MAGSTLYPRSTIKRVVKSHSGKNVSRNADVLVRCTLPLGPRTT